MIFLSMTSLLFNLFTLSISVAEDENEETYSIDLVQTAEVAKEIVDLGDKKVLTETYTAKEGDHIWKILRNKDVFNKNKLGGVLSALKKLNPSLSNIDMIHPGEKIVIPLVVTPIRNREQSDNPEDIETVSLEDMENLEFYTVSQGDHLIKIINQRYSIPGDKLYNEYLEKLKKLNPELKDLDHIEPGQKIRLPIYSPKIFRGTIEKKPRQEVDVNTLRLEARELGDNLSRIFTMIGEEWIGQGKHFIPLNTGGQVDLNTETYPIINLRNGDKIIIDLYTSLPDKMAALIRSNWANYQIIHIDEKDDLKSAVAKVLSVCNYNKIYTSDESLVFEDKIKIEITADWIIKLLPEPSDIKDNIICLNIINGNSGTLPSPVKNFLMNHGIKIINYPPGTTNEEDSPAASNTVTMDGDRNTVLEKILELTDQKYSVRENIPIYQEEDSDFNLIVKADYFFKRNGKDCIIDLSGLGTDIINLLKEHKFLVLSLPDGTKAGELIAKTLDFLGTEYDNKKHTFYALPGNEKENVKIIIPGILFKDTAGQSNLFSSIVLPPDISSFLSSRVDNIFFFKPSLEAE
jgi:hypothetical protein